MQDGAHAVLRDERRDLRPVGDVRFEEGDPLGDGVPVSRDEVVDHDGFAPDRAQPMDDMRPDIPGAAGDQDAHTLRCPQVLSSARASSTDATYVRPREFIE